MYYIKEDDSDSIYKLLAGDPNLNIGYNVRINSMDIMFELGYVYPLSTWGAYQEEIKGYSTGRGNHYFNIKGSITKIIDPSFIRLNIDYGYTLPIKGEYEKYDNGELYLSLEHNEVLNDNVSMLVEIGEKFFSSKIENGKKFPSKTRLITNFRINYSEEKHGINIGTDGNGISIGGYYDFEF